MSKTRYQMDEILYNLTLKEKLVYRNTRFGLGLNMSLTIKERILYILTEAQVCKLEVPSKDDVENLQLI